jgi:hypothetical protein
MAPGGAIYIGLRCGAAGPHGGPTVVGVREPESDRNLKRHPDALTLSCTFDWGYEGAGPKVLAEAILADRLGRNPDLPLTKAFTREVVAYLDSDFELEGRAVDDWVAHRLLQATSP